MALQAGDVGHAEGLAHQELAVAAGEQFHIELVICFELLADIAAANHDWQHAARLHGAAQRRRAEMGMTLRLAGYPKCRIGPWPPLRRPSGPMPLPWPKESGSTQPSPTPSERAGNANARLRLGKPHPT
jgi:hypothetical protein